MRKVDGRMPFTQLWGGTWKMLLKDIPKEAADAFLAEVPQVSDDDQGELPNEGFRVIRVDYGDNDELVAVVRQFGTFHLIRADEEEFQAKLFEQAGERAAVEVKPYMLRA